MARTSHRWDRLATKPAVPARSVDPAHRQGRDRTDVQVGLAGRLARQLQVLQVWRQLVAHILQEALQNIEKYANAKNVSVLMTKSDLNEINVAISDDGNGFDMKQKKNGIGIKNSRHITIHQKGLP